MSPLTFRKRFRLGPFFANVGRGGPLTWNATRGTTSVDLPGPVNYRSRPHKGRTSGGAR